jgi:hypothetical protein
MKEMGGASGVIKDTMNIQQFISNKLEAASATWAKRTTVSTLEKDIHELKQTLEQLKAMVKTEKRFDTHRYKILASLGIIEASLAELE